MKIHLLSKKLCKPILLILSFAVILVFGGCFNTDNTNNGNTSERKPLLEENEATTVTIYFTTSNHSLLLPLNMTVPATHKVAQTSLEKLLAGPPNDFAFTVVPADTKLIDLYIVDEEKIVYADLTSQITQVASASQAAVLLNSIVNTVLASAPEYQLQILVEGEKISDIGGLDASSPLSASLPNIVNQGTEGIPLTYYLGDDMAIYLVPQTLMVKESAITDQTAPQEELARIAIEQMLKTPAEDSGYYRTIWPGTKLLGLQVKNSVAYVDFSQEVLAYGGGTAAERMLVDSLTYSLTNIEGIEAVQLLVEGKILEFLPEGTDVSQPISPSLPLNFVY